MVLLSTLHITTATVNLSVNQGHGSQLATFSFITAKDVHPWESRQRKLGESSVLSIALTSLQINLSRFFSSISTAFDTCKTILIYSSVKGNDYSN